MFTASELPVAQRTLEATFIGPVDAARGVGTESAVSVMPYRVVGVSAWFLQEQCTATCQAETPTARWHD